MTVAELIERLENVDPNIEVKLALQPSYPMKGSIQNICLEHDEEDKQKCLWIACSEHESYDCRSIVWDEEEIGPNEED